MKVDPSADDEELFKNKAWETSPYPRQIKHVAYHGHDDNSSPAGTSTHLKFYHGDKWISDVYDPLIGVAAQEYPNNEMNKSFGGKLVCPPNIPIRCVFKGQATRS